MRLAARGARETTQGLEPVADTALLAQLRRQARVIQLQAVLAASSLTAAVLLLPHRTG